MKYIIAYIKSNMLGKVVRSLHKIEGLSGLSVMDIHGFGRGRGEDEKVFISDDSVKYVPHKNWNSSAMINNSRKSSIPSAKMRIPAFVEMARFIL